MHLYRFFNPSAYGADKCVIIVAANNVEALNAYRDRYFPDCHGIALSKDFHRDGCIVMEVSLKQLDDGKVVFCKIFAIEFC